MRSAIILFLIPALFIHPCFSQTKAQITDVDFHLEDRYIVVNYTLTGTIPKEQLTIDLKFINESNETILPETVTGDAGAKEYGNGAKTILWDVVADKVALTGSLKAIVTVTSFSILYRGPSNAFLSVIVPGLGGYFVDKNKTRAIISTVSAAGLMGYGIYEKLQANECFKDYEACTDRSQLDDLYSTANEHQHKYFITTRIAAGIWAADVIWVTIKGYRNKKLAQSGYNAISSDGLKILYVNNGLQLGYSVNF